MAALVALAGLPGTGKTTVARHFCRATGAVFLRVDAIEQALRDAGAVAGDLGPTGYHVAAALAEANLALGATVMVDSVNPIPLTRALWHGAAARAEVPCLDVELICSDQAIHRHRVAARAPDIPGLRLPDWPEVEERDYRPFPGAHLRLDTAHLTPDAAADLIAARLDELAAGPTPGGPCS